MIVYTKYLTLPLSHQQFEIPSSDNHELQGCSSAQLQIRSGKSEIMPSTPSDLTHSMSNGSLTVYTNMDRPAERNECTKAAVSDSTATPTLMALASSAKDVAVTGTPSKRAIVVTFGATERTSNNSACKNDA